MKKNNKHLVAMILLLALLLPIISGIVNAESFTMSLKTSVKQTKEKSEVIFTLSALNIVMGQGLTKIEFTVDYDDKVFEQVISSNINALNNWRLEKFDPKTKKVTLSRQSFQKETGDLAAIVLKTKIDTKGKEGVVSLTNISGSNGTQTQQATVVTAKVAIGDEIIELEKEKEKPVTPVKEEPVKKEEPVIPDVKKEEPKTTTEKKELPDAGLDDTIVQITLALAVVALISMFSYARANKKKVLAYETEIQELKNKETMDIEVK